LKTKYIARFTELKRREFIILVSLLIPIVLLGITTNFTLEFLNFPLSDILDSREWLLVTP